MKATTRALALASTFINGAIRSVTGIPSFLIVSDSPKLIPGETMHVFTVSFPLGCYKSDNQWYMLVELEEEEAVKLDSVSFEVLQTKTVVKGEGYYHYFDIYSDDFKAHKVFDFRGKVTDKEHMAELIITKMGWLLSRPLYMYQLDDDGGCYNSEGKLISE